MHTVDATLTAALLSGNYIPTARLYCLTASPDTWEDFEIIRFELQGTECKVTYKDESFTTPIKFYIQRGVLLDGSTHTHNSGYFYPDEIFEKDDIISMTGHIFNSARHIQVDANDTYKNVLTAVASEYDLAAVFSGEDEDYWGYEFLPAGRFIDVNRSEHFLQLIRQKYFLFAVDDGQGQVKFFYAGSQIGSDSADWTVEPDSVEFSNRVDTCNLLSRDEEGIATYSWVAGPSALWQVHNLGYIKSTDHKPYLTTPGTDVTSDLQQFSFTMRPDLRYQDGDTLYIPSLGVLSRLKVREVWDSAHSPTWQVEVRALNYLTAQNIGMSPNVIAALPFIELYTGNFDKILGIDDSNIQAAFETLDEHNHDADYQPLDNDLTSIAALGSAADKMPYTTAAHTWAEAALTAIARALLDDANAAAMRSTLELIAGGAGDIWVEKAGDTMTGSLYVNANVIAARSDSIYCPQLQVTSGYNGASGGYVAFYKSRGSYASPSIVSINDPLGSFNFLGYDGSGFQNAAGFGAFVAGTPGAGDMPGKLLFYTTPDGSSTVQVGIILHSTQMVGFEKGIYVGNSNGAATDDDIICDGTIKTASGKEYDLGGYTAGAPTADGYLTMIVDGVTYKVLCDKV